METPRYPKPHFPGECTILYQRCGHLTEMTHIYEMRDVWSYVKSEITLLKQHELYKAATGSSLPPFYYVAARGLQTFVTFYPTSLTLW